MNTLMKVKIIRNAIKYEHDFIYLDCIHWDDKQLNNLSKRTKAIEKKLYKKG